MSGDDCSISATLDLRPVLDFEDPSTTFYVFDDGSGGSTTPAEALIEPLPSAHCGSEHALHLQASGFTSWGGGLGHNLKPSLHSAEGYSGVALWVRAEVGSFPRVELTVQDSSAASVGEGGACLPEGDRQCGDLFHTLIGTTPEWRLVRVPFDSLFQAGWGVVGQLDTLDILGLQLGYRSSSYDVWVDDLAYYRESESAP
jgi:hypothetical protein